LPKGVPRAGHTVASTYAIATRPQPRRLWPSRGFIWEASDPYLYLRVGPEGRIICGGEDEPFADARQRDVLLPQKTATIEAKLRALLPGVDPRADYAWCGTFGMSETGTPSIGPVPRMPRCHAVLGYGGNGMTFSALAAQVLLNQMTGRGDPDSDLFSFRRRRPDGR
jgi:glycine/D-amino acid oxidase-like deaminating enzyme